MRYQWRSSPFPHASQLTLSSEPVAVLDDWGRVPVSEPDVTVVEIDEHWQGVWGSVLNRLVIRTPGLGWVAFVEIVAVQSVFPDAIDAISTITNSSSVSLSLHVTC